MKKQRAKKITTELLLKWLINQYRKTGFMPTSRDAAKRFNCCQTLAINHFKMLVKAGLLLKRGRQYALPRQKYTNDKPTEPGWYWHRSQHAEYILCLAHDPNENNLLSVYDEGGFLYLENYHGQWCGPIEKPISA